MIALVSEEGSESDHEALLRGVDALRARLQDPRSKGELDPNAIPSLRRVARAFELSDFEARVLLLCAAYEIDGAIAGLCARGGERPPFPTFGLALSLFSDGHWTALGPGAPLRHWLLVELNAAEGITGGRLRIHESVLHHLIGEAPVEDRPLGLLRRVPSADFLAPGHAEATARLAMRWTAGIHDGEPLPPIELVGEDRFDLEAAAARLCDLAGIPLFSIASSALPPAGGDLSLLLRSVRRELALRGACLLVDAREESETFASLVEGIDRGPIVLTRSPLRGWGKRRPFSLALAAPEGLERRKLWEEVTHGVPLPPAAIDRARGQFRLATGALSSVARRLRADAAEGSDPSELAERLWLHCRTEAARPLAGLAESVPVRASWDDLVLPAPQTSLLRTLIAQLRSRALVYEDWGFGDRSARGLGITALFAGPSGTGKTMAAEIVASALKLDLWRIDLSQVVSKWIGETEKNLARLFDAADPGGAVLLFDEADALFGKRSEVRDSHDRYANLEVSFLLQRMESYRGLAILTTNHEDALDTAFQRRIRTIVNFPFPDAKLRERIWSRVFPAETPTVGLRPDRLARLPLPGGTIRNVALTAAFLAADSGGPVSMAHLKEAAEIECAKIKRPIGRAETGDWLCP